MSTKFAEKYLQTVIINLKVCMPKNPIGPNEIEPWRFVHYKITEYIFENPLSIPPHEFFAHAIYLATCKL